MLDDKTAACAPQQEEVDAATRVFLRANAEPRSTTNDVLSVELPHGIGRQTQQVRLRSGDWIVDWPRSPTVRRITVTATQAPAIKLTTIIGRCELRQRKCVVTSQAESRRIEILDGPIPEN